MIDKGPPARRAMNESSYDNNMNKLFHTSDPNQSARAFDSTERVLAFVFAAADMVVEVDEVNQITFAAGAFLSKFDRSPESFVGRSVRELFAPVDYQTIDTAIALLIERRRLAPIVIRLGNRAREQIALGGMMFAAREGVTRLCLSLARLPNQATDSQATIERRDLAGIARNRSRTGETSDLGLLQLSTDENPPELNKQILASLDVIAPNSVAVELSPNRFGLLGPGCTATDLAEVSSLLETALHAQGFDVSVAANHIALSSDGLTQTQVTRALRQALTVFGRNGAAGLSEAGFDGGLNGFIKRASAQTQSLRRAISGHHFAFAFQPIVSLSDGSLLHYEALLRPKPFEGIPTAPQEFVLLAEALEMASELDFVVARAACDAATRTRAPIAFNVSAQSLQSNNFHDRLCTFLRSSPACRDGLIAIEMTETAELDYLPRAAQAAKSLRSLGVSFCLDDFGAGINDIKVLRAVPADFVKLDGSYVRGVAESERQRSFVVGMAEMARGAGARIVAEHIETPVEAEIMRDVGVLYGQGWLFGRPGALPDKRGTVHRDTARRKLAPHMS